MIYRRTLASQMPNERYTSTTVHVDAGRARFKATGKHVDFPGYRLAWPTSGQTTELPDLAVGDELNLEDLEPKGHETQPPKRFTEASLVEALEDEGIGRPSTYAEIISRIQEKEYVEKHGRSLVPTLTAFAVVTFLEEHFPRLIDPDFTAEMEDALDQIATGEADSLPYLEDFFLGEEGLQARVDETNEAVEGSQARAIVFEDLPYVIKVGRYGPYVEHRKSDDDVVRANLPGDLTPDEIDETLVERLVHQEEEGPEALGEDPDTGLPVYALTGRYGPYVQLGDDGDHEGKPPRASLPDDMDVDEVDLETALWLLELPKPIGDHPDGGEILVGIGRYGPYVCHDPPGDADRDYKNVDDWETLREIDVDEAVDAIEQAKKGKKQGVIREMGEHPDTGSTIELRGGRYGPYFKHQGDNKSLPDGVGVDEATFDDAVFLVDLPETLGDHPDGGTVLKDLGRYGPYVAHEDEDGDRTYVSLADYEDLRQADLEDAMFLLTLPEELGPHPEGGKVRIDQDRDGAYLEHEAGDGETLKTVRGLPARRLRKMAIDDALAHV
jgi:DNA topoisomerase-1